MDDADDLQIDPELWLRFLLIMAGDEQKQRALVEHLSRRTGLVPERVEEFLRAATEAFLQMTRSN